jgi:predicted Zn finger-like uncharacterized protein
MPVDIECPGCGRRFRVSDSAVGKQVKCPNCGSVIVVPVPARQSISGNDKNATPYPTGVQTRDGQESGDSTTGMVQSSKSAGRSTRKRVKVITVTSLAIVALVIVIGTVALAGKRSAQKRQEALLTLKGICDRELPVGIVGFRPPEVEKIMAGTRTAHSDYWIYLVIPGDPTDKVVPYRGGMLGSEEVRSLAHFCSECPENTLSGATADRLFFYFGGGKTADIAEAPTLVSALRECTEGKIPEVVFLRFECDTHQLVISCRREIKVDPETLALHPDWRSY